MSELTHWLSRSMSSTLDPVEEIWSPNYEAPGLPRLEEETEIKGARKGWIYGNVELSTRSLKDLENVL